jgi:hypothetical protein
MSLVEHKLGVFHVWVPASWNKIDLKKRIKGLLLSPYTDDINTSLLAEKRKLKYRVFPEDLPVLREGFQKGIEAMPGFEIETQEEKLSEKVSYFEARFTFLDGDRHCKRWVRNYYWDDEQLIVVAQGRSLQDFGRLQPLFYTIMMSITIDVS